MTAERRKIIDRVHKLRRLGAEPGPEGESARAIADKLIAEHRLTPEEATERVEPVVIHAPGRAWKHRDDAFVGVAASVCLHAYARARVEDGRVVCQPGDPMALLAISVVNDLKYALGPWSTSRETLEGFALGFIGEMARLDPMGGTREVLRREQVRTAARASAPERRMPTGGLPANPTPPRGRSRSAPGAARARGGGVLGAHPGIARVSSTRGSASSPAYMRGIEMGRAMAARVIERLRRYRIQRS